MQVMTKIVQPPCIGKGPPLWVRMLCAAYFERIFECATTAMVVTTGEQERDQAAALPSPQDVHAMANSAVTITNEERKFRRRMHYCTKACGKVRYFCLGAAV